MYSDGLFALVQICWRDIQCTLKGPHEPKKRKFICWMDGAIIFSAPYLGPKAP